MFDQQERHRGGHHQKRHLRLPGGPILPTAGRGEYGHGAVAEHEARERQRPVERPSAMHLAVLWERGEVAEVICEKCNCDRAKSYQRRAGGRVLDSSDQKPNAQHGQVLNAREGMREGERRHGGHRGPVAATEHRQPAERHEGVVDRLLGHHQIAAPVQEPPALEGVESEQVGPPGRAGEEIRGERRKHEQPTSPHHEQIAGVAAARIGQHDLDDPVRGDRTDKATDRARDHEHETGVEAEQLGADPEHPGQPVEIDHRRGGIRIVGIAVHEPVAPFEDLPAVRAVVGHVGHDEARGQVGAEKGVGEIERPERGERRDCKPDGRGRVWAIHGDEAVIARRFAAAWGWSVAIARHRV